MKITITIRKTFEAYEDEKQAIRGKSKAERDQYFIEEVYADPPGFFDGAMWKITVRYKK